MRTAWDSDDSAAQALCRRPVFFLLCAFVSWCENRRAPELSERRGVLVGLFAVARDSGGWNEQGEFWEVRAEVAAIDCGESVGLHRGMRRDEEIRDEVVAWPSLASVTQEDPAGQICGSGLDGVVDDVETVQVLLSGFQGWVSNGILGKYDGAEEEFALMGGSLEAIAPRLPSVLFADELDQDGTVEGGAHLRMRSAFPGGG